MNKAISIFLSAIILMACSKSDEDVPSGDEDNRIVKTTITGKIEKGPFLTGSKITLYELEKELKQTGKNIFKTETTNDNGDFVFDSKMELLSQFVELEISGYFFNEVTGIRSSSQITLNVLADVSGKDKVNVNILTHLVYKRIKNLISEGLSFPVAQKQAHKELLNVFYIANEVKNSDDIGLTDGNDDAAVLLAISAILLHDKREAEFSEFIAKLSNDFADDGTISDSDLMGKIHLGQQNVNSIKVMDNLKSYFSEQGKTIEVQNIRKFIDGNGDGILDDKDANLDRNPNESITEDEIFKNEEVFKQALTGSYDKVRGYFERMLVLDAVRCNLIDYSIDISSDNTILKDAWAQAYQAIHRLNQIIEHSQDDANQYAKPYHFTSRVLRALLYLDMVQHWGDVPFITKPLTMEEIFVPRTDKVQIFNSLLIDLDESMPYLEEDTEHNQMFVSQDLAIALIAAIQLERKDYSTAATYFEKIINKGNKISLDNTVYSDINNNEALFTLLFSESEDYQPFQVFSQHLKKGNLHPIYRNTDVFLSYAEALVALNKTSESLSLLNKVRAADNMAPLQDFPLKPEHEIADLWKKFIGSDYGYFSLLKRLGIAVELLDIQSYHQLYPIPLTELMMNPNITQNPGY
jgi:tetratricopeptide (TPR) repeat protein